jgi:lipopolysaccharide export LptBFGC system permease protein LptF
MRTLQLYVARELLKTFALAAVGLTLVLTLCGAMLSLLGAMSSIAKVDVPTAETVVNILLLIQPMVWVVTLPVSALFASAIVYGRLAADNEFDACRASGVNIHRLMAPAFVLSLLMAVFAFTFSNYVIPKAIGGIVNRVQNDISKLAYQALKSRGYFKLEKTKNEVQVLHADKVDLVKENGKEIMVFRDAAFLEFKNDELVRCGTVRQGRAEFGATGENAEPVFEAFLDDFRAIDIPQRRLYQESRRPFGSRQLPRTILYDPKWLPLGDLLKYKDNPTQLPLIRVRMTSLRQLVRDGLFYRRLCDYFSPGSKPLLLDDGRHRYEIRAESARIPEETTNPQLKKVSVIHTWTEEGGRKRVRAYKAGGAEVSVSRNYANTGDVMLIELNDGVTFTDSLEPGKSVPHASAELEPISAPQAMLGGDQAYSDEQLLGLSAIAGKRIRKKEDLMAAVPSLGLGLQVEKTRLKTLADMLRQRHQIIGTLHSRLSFCASALVTIVLAAALGIIFRNGQFLTAFAISFLPGLVLVAMNMMGRRQAESPDPALHMIGIGVIWGGIVLLALVDLVVLTRYLKR